MRSRNDLFCSTDARVAADIFTSSTSRSVESQGATTPSGDWRVRRIVHDLDALDVARLGDGAALSGDTNSDEDESALDILTRRMVEDERPHTQSADGDIEVIKPVVERQNDDKTDPIDLVSDEEGKVGHVEVASTAAIGEANVNEVDPNTSNNPSAQLLYRPSDENFLSPLRCFIRRQIELFEATPEDVCKRNSSIKGATARKIIVGQVGMRCIHCAHVPVKHHTKNSVCYPHKIDGIKVWNSFHEHMLTCLHIPQSVRDQHKALNLTTKKGTRGKPSSAPYLLQRYKEIIVEKDGRLGFSRTASGPRIPSANTTQHWTCDICNLATFTDYDDARKHEETCNDSHQLRNDSSPQHAELVHQAAPAESEDFANPCTDADADVATMVSADKGQNSSVADQPIVLPGDDNRSVEDRNQCNLEEQEEEEGLYRFQGKAYRTYSDI